jgi:hypothetical protein
VALAQAVSGHRDAPEIALRNCVGGEKDNCDSQIQPAHPGHAAEMIFPSQP